MMKILESKELLRTPIFWVTMDKAIDPEGFEIDRAIIQHGGSSVVMPVDEKGIKMDALATILAALLAPLALLALALLTVLAWLSSRTTVYTLTNRRVVMRVGIVLSITFNLPLRQVESAGLRPVRGGHGDIALVLAPGERIAYLHLWPHVRPWQLRRTQPMLRCVADAATVGQLLTRAAAEVPAEQPVRVPPSTGTGAQDPADGRRAIGGGGVLAT